MTLSINKIEIGMLSFEVFINRYSGNFVSISHYTVRNYCCFIHKHFSCNSSINDYIYIYQIRSNFNFLFSIDRIYQKNDSFGIICTGIFPSGRCHLVYDSYWPLFMSAKF